jgi:hypothetical protein
VGLGLGGVVGLPSFASSFGLLSLLDHYVFLESAFSFYFTCTRCSFLQSVKASDTSGNRLVAKVYVCKNM